MRSSSDLTDNTPTAIWLVLLVLALAVHVFGLDGQYIPSNGDEMVYAHIARETAETGRWLPLASELADTRNTKPPLLFWQAMVAGEWGRHWSLAALRAPSLIYSLLIAAAVAWTVRLISANKRDALIAACVYLTFFSTFRYGRAYLTSAPETFWFSLPLFALLWQKLRAPESSNRPGWVLHALFGLALGLGLAYKSFALIAPAAAAWWLALALSEPRFDWRALLQITLRVSFSAALALGVFGLWFVLDPDPGAVWREFIVAENAGKFSDSQGYWHEALLGGGSSVWSQLLAYAVNAGLLAFVVLGLAVTGWNKRFRPLLGTRLPPHLGILLAWALVWLIVFTLPSQRSARYVIPAMPAIAILLALYWRDIPRAWFMPTLPLAGVVLLLLARIAWVSHDIGLSGDAEFAVTLLVVVFGAITLIAAMVRSAWTRTGAVLACLLVYASFGLSVAPMDGPLGHYSQTISASLLPRARIAVPSNFNGQFERFRFLLPGNYQFVPYDAEARTQSTLAPGSAPPPTTQQLEQLLAAHDAVIWVQSDLSENTPSCLPACAVLGQRWQLKSRYRRGEITWTNLWYPGQWLFRREWLLTRAASR